MKIVTEINDVLKDSIKSNQNIFVQGAMQTPTFLLSKLEQALREREDVENLKFLHLHTHGEPFYIRDEFKNRCKTLNFFVGANVRKSLDFTQVDYIPCFLSEITYLLRDGVLKNDIALIQVSRPNEHGYVSLGTSVDITKEAVKTASIVIAQINEEVPLIHGDSFIHTSDITYGVYKNENLHYSKKLLPTENELKIGKSIAELIEDGSTLQMGIGAIPDAVLSSLTNHKDLGIHTEMFSNGIIELTQKGIITNKYKKINPGKTISSFAVGTKELRDFMCNNPSVELYPANYVNKPKNIAKNPRVVAINSAVEIDLTGQVCADSIGSHIISGVGGQMDFIRGASISHEGKPIIAMCSTTKSGKSKIVSTLINGAGVVTTRAHVHYVATEYGCVNLYGKSIGKRAKLLTSIAHPKHREDLERAWKEILS